MPNPTTAFIEEWLPGPDGHRFYTRTYPATFPRAVVVFAHAFRDHLARHADVHAIFAQRHITVFAYDLRGYGRTALDTKNRSPGAAYGKTNRAAEVADLEWWVRRVAGDHQNLPLFLLGYGGGGGLSLVFATRPEAPPKSDTLSKIAGIIVVSPLVELAAPPAKAARPLVRTVASLVPFWPVSYPVLPEQCSRDPAVVASIACDPLVKTQGRAQSLLEMITQGEELLEAGWRRWPKSLPLLMLWGTANEVHSPAAGKAFFDQITCTDKKLVTYKDALDDLMHEAGDIPGRILDDCIAWIEARIQRKGPTVA